MTRTIAFVIDLMQDVNIQRPLFGLAAALPDTEALILASHLFLKRDTTGMWLAELQEASEKLGQPLHSFATEFEAYKHLQGRRGVIVASAESTVSGHALAHNIFLSAPAGFVRVTLQHGFECVGFLHNAAHDRAHGMRIGFNADVVCGWFADEVLTSFSSAERSKLLVTGPTLLLPQWDRIAIAMGGEAEAPPEPENPAMEGEQPVEPDQPALEDQGEVAAAAPSAETVIVEETAVEEAVIDYAFEAFSYGMAVQLDEPGPEPAPLPEPPPAVYSCLICENLHSVRMAGAVLKSDFIAQFTDFAVQAAKQNIDVWLRPHPAGRFMEVRGVALPPKVRMSSLPIYKENLSRFSFGVSAPSSILFDLMMAGVPVAVWQDAEGDIDCRNYGGLPTISCIDDWWDFAAEVEHERERLMTRQAEFIRRLGMPDNVLERYAALLGSSG